MTDRSPYAPTHRLETRIACAVARRGRAGRVLRHAAVATAAVAATAGVVGGTVLAADDVATGSEAVSAAADSEALTEVVDGELAARIVDRGATVSRADRREGADPAKQAALAPVDAAAVTRTQDVADQDPRTIARSVMGSYGFSADQFSCLDSLWTKESGWDVHADNPTSSAYGIPQSLPGEKMASAGADWADNPATQIRWGLGYIQDRYGSPCSAWAHSQANNWY